MFVWTFAFVLSLGLRFWGLHHPEPFIIRPFIVWGLLFAPSALLLIYLTFIRFRKFGV
ncbi:Hypothetical protein P9211_18451 [Prochlorococcus marinus str. MIT 9211]|uniref:Uncharacterized protein n=1 Tax=Prochlorococcus marinus (strain MIT 9211) TaxID=93059 RepID=A9BDR4_PROM4|nr:Hypothetical protein P9211_18451 [Prochlorococcus marinus str. MIT 9211]